MADFSAMKVSIGKYEAASRQLQTAIRLFFCEDDFISILALAGAATEVLRDLAKPHGILAELHDADFIKDEHRKEYINFLRKPRNFIKHADRDAEEVLEYDSDLVKFDLLEACILHCKLAPKLGHPPMSEAWLFHIWFSSAHPHFLINPEKFRELPGAKNLSQLNPGGDLQPFRSFLGLQKMT